MTMRAISLLAASAAGALAFSGAVYAQDLSTMPTQTDVPQQSAQSSQTDMNGSSYGGATSTSRSGGMSQSTWTSGTSSACVTGLSCNIYQGN
jgi:ketosteroid isomerase-like protein